MKPCGIKSFLGNSILEKKLCMSQKLANEKENPKIGGYFRFMEIKVLMLRYIKTFRKPKHS